MIRTIIWFLDFVISLILVTPFLIIGKYKEKKYGRLKASKYADKKIRLWVKSKFVIAGANINVKGTENIPENENIVFISNHQSNFDIAIILKYIPGSKGFVAKSEMKSVPLLKQWMELIGCVFINRKSPKESIEAIRQATKNVKEGMNMVIFPEGSRSKGKPIGDFKLGSFRVAIKSKAVIVPITIDGSYKLLEEKNRISPSSVDITIHKPIYVKELGKDELDNINIIVRDKIIEGVNMK